MEEKYTLDDFANVICLRNQLENVPLNTLLDVYKDDESFVAFLEAISVLSNTDSGFLLLDPLYMEKISSVINSRRWDIENIDVKKAINDLIGYMNELRNYPNNLKVSLLSAYIGYHEELRQVSFDDANLLKVTLGYDAVVYSALENGDLDIAKEDELFLMSTNYLLEIVPDIYKNEDYKNMTIERIDRIRKKSRFFNPVIKTYSKNTKQRLIDNNKKTSE